jgi:hypothetical protein
MNGDGYGKRVDPDQPRRYICRAVLKDSSSIKGPVHVTSPFDAVRVLCERFNVQLSDVAHFSVDREQRPNGDQ